MKVFISGGGTMGSGMTQTFAQGGFETVLRVRDLGGGRREKLMGGFEKSLGKLVEKGKMEEAEKRAILGRIILTQELTDAKDCDLVIEAALEEMELKKKLFAELDSFCKPEAIFATNTSSLSITEIANATNRQDKFIGMHFFNPVSLMKLVEIIRGVETSDETYETIFNLTKKINKEPVQVNESPGFVVNRLLVPMINEAIFVLQENIASAEDIDTSMKLGANHPMGPLALSDLIGNDVILNTMDVLYSETGDGKYRACPLLRKMVRGGLLGKKTSKGFYTY